jgi:hypothetical protein
MDKCQFLMYNSTQGRSPENSVGLFSFGQGLVLTAGCSRPLNKGESWEEVINGDSFSQGRGSRSQRLLAM